MKIVLSSKSWLVLSKYQLSASNSIYKIPKTQQQKHRTEIKDMAPHLRSDNEMGAGLAPNPGSRTPKGIRTRRTLHPQYRYQNHRTGDACVGVCSCNDNGFNRSCFSRASAPVLWGIRILNVAADIRFPYSEKYQNLRYLNSRNSRTPKSIRSRGIRSRMRPSRFWSKVSTPFQLSVWAALTASKKRPRSVLLLRRTANG